MYDADDYEDGAEGTVLGAVKRGWCCRVETMLERAPPFVRSCLLSALMARTRRSTLVWTGTISETIVHASIHAVGRAVHWERVCEGRGARGSGVQGSARDALLTCFVGWAPNQKHKRGRFRVRVSGHGVTNG